MSNSGCTDATAQRLAAVNQATLGRLTDFARGRLISVGLPRVFSEDLPQVAICSVMTGARNPRAQDIATDAAFENYLRGIISSKVEAMTRKLVFEPIPEEDVLATAIPSPDELVQRSDLKQMLFRQLKQRAAPRHIPTIEQWEKVFDHSDRIPAIRGRRKYVAEIRKLAKQILTELGVDCGGWRGHST